MKKKLLTAVVALALAIGLIGVAIAHAQAPATGPTPLQLAEKRAADVSIAYEQCSIEKHSISVGRERIEKDAAIAMTDYRNQIRNLTAQRDKADAEVKRLAGGKAPAAAAAPAPAAAETKKELEKVQGEVKELKKDVTPAPKKDATKAPEKK